MKKLKGTDKVPYVFYPFPSFKNEPDLRQQWIKAINRKDTQNAKIWEPTKDSRVCSIPFPNNVMDEKNNVPSLHLGYRQLKTPLKRTAPKTRASVINKKENVDDESERISNWDHNYNHICKCSKNCQCLGCVQKETQLRKKRHELCEVKQELFLHECKKESILDKFISSDEKVSKFTDLLSKNQFNDLFDHLKLSFRKITQYRQGVKIQTLEVLVVRNVDQVVNFLSKEEFLMVLIKLRQGLHNDMLAEFFGVSETTLSSDINT